MRQSWTVEPEQAGQRADLFLASAMGVSRGEAQRLLEAGAAHINGSAAKSSVKLKTGDRVEVERLAPVQTETLPEEIPLEVVFEDADLLVINKPRGMVAHPAPGHESGTLVNAVLSHAEDLSGIGGERRPGIVHRLDKDTSGLLMVAKNDRAHLSLQAQIQAKTAQRIYLAILWGAPRFERALIEAPIGRHLSDRKKMAVRTDSHRAARAAVTELTIREPLGAFSLAEARLQTGRTHQIRVHCAYIGYPVAGDPLYGGQRKVPSQGIAPHDRMRIEEAIHALGGQALHAQTLSFDHPRTGERLSFSVPPPDSLQNLLILLREVYGR